MPRSNTDSTDPQARSTSMPIMTRQMPVGTVNQDARTVDVVWTAGAQVLRYDWYRDRSYLEELSTEPGAVRMERLQSGTAPVLNNHDGWSGLDAVLGVVQSADIDSADGSGTATLRFSRRPDADPVFQDVVDGILRNVSVGYRTYRVDMIPPGQEGNDQWIYRAVDWEPNEISMVPINADVGATTRGAGAPRSERSYPCEFAERNAGNQASGANSSPNHQGVVMRVQDQSQNDTRTQSTPVQAPAPASPDVATQQAESARAEGAQAERQRVIDIRQAVRASTLDDQDALITGFIDQGIGADAVRAHVLRMQAERSAAAGIRGQADIQTVQDEADTRREAMTDALMHRINPRHALTDVARQYRGMNLRELCRSGLEAAGVDTRGMDVRALAGAALGMGARGAYNTTSDLPVVFGNVINRTLREAYTAAPRSFSAWARQGMLTDFRAATRVMVDGAIKLEKVNEAGEYKYGSLVDGGEVIQLGTYGKIVNFTRAMIINDDLSALERVPVFFGRAAANLESDLVYSALTGNVKMSDGKVLFDAAHSNVGAAGAIGIDTLSAGRSAMRTQKAPGDGTALNLAPRFLIVPAALETAAGQYTSNQYTPNVAREQNPFFGVLTPIVEPRLDAISPDAWYLAADPSVIDTVEYCYLEGEEGLYTEQSLDFDVDGLKVKARLDFAAKAVDFRGLYKNPGK
ncbi:MULTISPECIES: prohead protease/major capsid protein fusion protein [unclassified Burkholderia]|uniref:prohead protease/major capsid protein fusion protein n=1 Tax=unclassified Burkholderia TaxID=2613784 RepID=UPI0021AB57E8|nr:MULTISPECIES: prohead protease/major capsid protein fusion protein [unclassified Burkholderia]